MVRAAGEVGGDAGCATDFSRRGQRSADRAAGALDHLRRPGKTDAPLHVECKRPLLDCLDVTRIVDESQIVQVDRIGYVKIVRGQQTLDD